MSRSKINWIGITLGDPSGIGPEVVAKALRKRSIRSLGHFKIIGDRRLIHQYNLSSFKNCLFVDLKNFNPGKSTHRPNRHSGLAALQYIDRAIELLKNNEIQSLVTAPVSKEAVAMSGIKFQGHTEHLAQAFQTKSFGMMFVTDTLKTIVVTRHVPIDKVSRALKLKEILDTIRLTNQTLKIHFRISKPRIAVCGLNPHAGENGMLGREEIDKIIPAIKISRREGINALGPFAADTLFIPKSILRFDAVVAMYHDQGLIPIKTLHFNRVVNLTIGLPFVRTSPAHGTAFDIAGKNIADPSSMCEAIKLAAALSTKGGPSATRI